MSAPLRISFITTLRHNVGDDFARDGVRAIVDSICDYDAYFIHKERPGQSCTSAEPEDEGLELADKILDADVVINAGTPVYWNNGEGPGYKCSNEKWIEPLWYERIARAYRSIPILNLAAGAGQGYFGSPHEIADDPECAQFVRDIHRFCRLTVVRDRMAEQVHELLGLSVVRSPCVSIHAWRRHPRPAAIRNRIALNFMALGGHWEIRNTIDRDRWARSFVEIDRRLRSAGMDVGLVAHDRTELNALQGLLPGRPVFYSTDYLDYFSFYGHCAGGIFNRVHGAMLLAGAGSPTIVIGNDARSLVLEEMDLPRYYVNTAEPAQVVAHLLKMLSSNANRVSLLRHEALAFEEISARVKQALPARGLRRRLNAQPPPDQATGTAA
jgi:Polysaccharide pyruvyl transferase